MEKVGFEMIAILGRGIQRLSETSPVEDIHSWVLTEDLELCDTDSGHLPVRAPVNDESPYCMVGGGKMNLEAGKILIQTHQPSAVVCAYGGRSGYLESIGAPSESEVMSYMLHDHFRDQLRWSLSDDQPGIVVWDRSRQLLAPSNTRQELLNIFDLALEHGLKRIGLVTIGVHVPRTNAYISKHFSVYPKYLEGGLAPILLESEEVLLAADREKNTTRVQTMRNSKSFARNWARESIGISKIVRDEYGDAKPAVVAQDPSRDSSKKPLGANAS